MAPQSESMMGRLFLHFQALYGNRMTTMWGEADPAKVKAVWAEALAPYDAEDVRQALSVMQRECLDYPPTLPRFVDYCRHAAALKREANARIAGPLTPMPEHARAALRAFSAKHRIRECGGDA